MAVASRAFLCKVSNRCSRRDLPVESIANSVAQVTVVHAGICIACLLKQETRESATGVVNGFSLNVLLKFVSVCCWFWPVDRYQNVCTRFAWGRNQNETGAWVGELLYSSQGLCVGIPPVFSRPVIVTFKYFQCIGTGKHNVDVKQSFSKHRTMRFLCCSSLIGHS